MKDKETLIKDLHTELDEVSGKLVRLISFLNKDGFSVPYTHRELLVRQRNAMMAYTDVLRERINDVRMELVSDAERDVSL